MECKDYRKSFQLFLKDKLDLKENGKLIKHIDSCPACREELRTQYLVVEGLKRLETGDSFNLMHDFDDKLESTRKHNKHIQTSRTIVVATFLFMLAYTFGFLILGIL